MRIIIIILTALFLAACSMSGENKMKEAVFMGLMAVNFYQTEKLISNPEFESAATGKNLDAARMAIILIALGQLAIANNLDPDDQDKFLEESLIINSMVVGHNQFLMESDR